MASDEVLTDLPALLQQGQALQEQGRLGEARAVFDRVLTLMPMNLDALRSLGVMAAAEGNLELAAQWMGRALDVNPNQAALHFQLGLVQRGLNATHAALASFERAVAANPDYAQAHCNRGSALQELERSQEAVDSYDRAIALKPDYAFAYCNRGIALHRLKRDQEALESFDCAIALKPDYAAAYTNRGLTLHELKRNDEALASYERAIALQPNDAEIHYLRGSALMDVDRDEEALASFDAAIAIRSDQAHVYGDRGIVLHGLQRFDDALESYDKAIAIDAEMVSPHWNKSLLLLTLGRFEEGWQLHEWRWKLKGMVRPRAFGLGQGVWLGNEPLAGKTILLHAEQGLGDTIQFCRYAKLINALGATVLLEVPKALSTLLASLEGVDLVIEEGSPLPAFDYHCPLMSLPLAFKTRLETIPSSAKYLHAQPAKVGQWRQRLGAATRPRVGLVWSGGFRPDQPELWALNERRNLPLEQLKALAGLNVDFISLQKGEPAESEFVAAMQAGWDGPAIANYSADLQDFSDTAALIEALDLVISVDTSVAHLAAALGKPVWILNRFDSCWRWLQDRTDSPWYPTVRLYNQRRAGDWEEVMQRVRQDLLARSG